MSIRLTTWNINSVRLRLDLLRQLAEIQAPDVICLQETKVMDELFPHGAVEALGYPYQAIYGMKGYNGVAILSKLPLGPAGRRDWCGRRDARHVFATLPGGVELHNLYVPAGGDLPDPEANEKFAHKLQFLNELEAWLKDEARAAVPARSPKAAKGAKGAKAVGAAVTPGAGGRILVGDLNIAPLEADVWSHKQLLSVVSHTPVEVEHLTRCQAAYDWVDAVRHFIPEPEQVFTWWSYRNRDWAKSDRGRRLDHIWVSPELAPALAGAEILREARDWQKPSDHVPVTVTLDLPRV
ncbi:MAG: endonuclease/exonuclease/phosphatase family protein [Alphaproteobacteria bacterium]